MTGFQALALRFGAIFIGVILLFGAIQSIKTGRTTGREGSPECGYSVVRRTDMPFYFWFLFTVRLLLGLAAVITGVIIK